MPTLPLQHGTWLIQHCKAVYACVSKEADMILFSTAPLIWGQFFQRRTTDGGDKRVRKTALFKVNLIVDIVKP